MQNIAILIGGAPGTGKSTLARSLQITLDLIHLDIDEITKALNLEANGSQRWDIIFEKYVQTLEMKKSLIVSATFKQMDSRVNFMSFAEIQNYKVFGFFLNTPEHVLIKRYEMRGQNHFVNQTNGKLKLDQFHSDFNLQTNEDLSKWYIFDSNQNSKQDLLSKSIDIINNSFKE